MTRSVILRAKPEGSHELLKFRGIQSLPLGMTMDVTMEIKAELNYFHMSPRKVRLIAGLIKGMDVRRAELELGHAAKRSGAPLLKLLRSAVANAEHNFNQHREDLYVKEMRIDPGPMLKRNMPRAFGRAALIRKRMSHVRLRLGVWGKDNVEAKRI